MAKIIFTSQYLRDAPPAKLANYVEYIATREGVEKIDTSKRNLPTTKNQKQFIKQLIRDVPSAKEMLEYEDYCLHPTIGNATEFISQALEQNLNLIAKRENYVDYIANRPRVERMGEHGLFTDAGSPVVLSQVQEEVANHKGVIWTHVISLRREDAARLGYDSGEQWQELIRSKRAMLSRQMKIDSENLRWYCAFHNESHHPHCHLMVYSTKSNEGYLSKPGIEAMRSELAHTIFRQDFANIYKRQNQTREQTKRMAAEVMTELLSQIGQGTCENKVIEELILKLSQRLLNTSGKKVYGYLKADVKNIIDQIVDELAKEERIKQLYEAWGDCQDEITKHYTNKTMPLPPLVKQKQFKSIKNMVIAEALQIGSGHISFDDEALIESESEPIPMEQGEDIQEGFVFQEPDDDFSLSDWEEEDIAFHANWTKAYQLARKHLYGSEQGKSDFQKAFKGFLLEAQAGNAMAMHDLGRMYADGLGREHDADAADQWYREALIAFHAAEKKKSTPYLQYRIGKMYAAGLGTEQNYEQAAAWYLKAVGQEHKYAQYSLAGLYYRGQGVEQSFEKAFVLYRSSAAQDNPYAQYELGNMYRDGIGTDRNEDAAKLNLELAFDSFVRMEEKSHDDKLQYRIGHMLYTGTGVKKDVAAAVIYFEAAAKLGNMNAGYMLGKIGLETGTGDPQEWIDWIKKAADAGNANAEYALAKIYRDGIHVKKDMSQAIQFFEQAAEKQNEYAMYQLGRLYLKEDACKDIGLAVKWLTAAADLNNSYAQYALAKLYQEGEEVPVNLEKAIELYTLSANQKNEYAAYQLGKLYLSGKEVEKDIEKAIHWLTESAEQGNQFAQYALGKLYFYDNDVERDKEKSLFWLSASAAQGNIYAQYLINNIHLYGEPSLLLAATRLMHRLEQLFLEDYHRSASSGAIQIDRKRRRQLQEKKKAMGHAHNDTEPKQQIT